MQDLQELGRTTVSQPPETFQGCPLHLSLISPSMYLTYSLRDLDMISAASLCNAKVGGSRRAVNFVRKDWGDLSAVVVTQDILLSDRVVNITMGTGAGGRGGGVASASAVTYR